MTNTATRDFIASNSRKTIWLMISFIISLTLMVYLIVLLINLVSSKQSYHDQAFIFTLAGQTAVYVLPKIFLIAIVWLLISYFAGHNFIISSVRAIELTKKNAPEIVTIVENIAVKLGLPTPKVYSINEEALNAFATGRDPKHSYIVLTKGLINKLEKAELEGVIAHEIAHIRNRDTRLMLIMIVCISFATIAAELLLQFALTAKTSNSKNKNVFVILMFVLAAVLYIYGYLIAPLIKLAVSRTREFQADATAALITNPRGLIDALKKISINSAVKNLSEPFSPICIANPLDKNKRNTFFSKISGLLATHPSIEDRIKALHTMSSSINNPVKIYR